MGNPERRNRNLYCQYHQDHGHTTEDCRSLWDQLDLFVREGKLKQLLHHSNGQEGKTGSCRSRVMSVARLSVEDVNRGPKKAGLEIQPILGFSNEDKVGTIQPYDDALVVTLRIGGYDVKRVMVDQGSGIEIMYPDLYKGLNLKPKDLTPYSSSLVSFDGKIVIPKGQIRLPV
ncbi:uncharacterized protein LOC136066491 [Quercus suber]|uniref:uncharacterized protein LOC136066491 n=1 Tax=Quercus suber TaxID=58331 RepID=UPI0032DF7A29